MKTDYSKGGLTLYTNKRKKKNNETQWHVFPDNNVILMIAFVSHKLIKQKTKFPPNV